MRMHGQREAALLLLLGPLRAPTKELLPMSKYRRRECRSMRLLMVWKANSSSVPAHMQRPPGSGLSCNACIASAGKS